MKIGIIANTKKEKIYEVIGGLIKILKKNNFEYLLSSELRKNKNLIDEPLDDKHFQNEDELCKKSDMIVSIGGDGTMLASAHKAQFYDKPILGINLGNLGFLAEVNINQMDAFISQIKNNNYEIQVRMVITGECIGHKIEKLYAINDIVIDKGGWPKMIDITINVGNEHVTTFASDGIIVATPTGSTGYSISTGGPIVSPKLNVITLSPICPHSLTVRPLVLPSDEVIIIKADSLHKEVLINCDGQRVFAFPPPLQIKITKSSRPLKLVHTSLTSYFETLRNKLLWGIDLRKNSI